MYASLTAKATVCDVCGRPTAQARKGPKRQRHRECTLLAYHLRTAAELIEQLRFAEPSNLATLRATLAELDLLAQNRPTGHTDDAEAVERERKTA